MTPEERAREIADVAAVSPREILEVFVAAAIRDAVNERTRECAAFAAESWSPGITARSNWATQSIMRRWPEAFKEES